MRVVVLLYRAQLPPFSVKTRPWHIRVNRLAKPLEDLQLLLLTEHQFASGRTLKLEDKLRLGTSELLLDLGGHPIEPSGDLLLISAREPDTRALSDLRLYGHRAVGQIQLRYASNNVFLVFHVAGGFGSECKRVGIPGPVALVGEGTLWQVLIQYFCSGFTIYLVNDVSLG